MPLHLLGRDTIQPITATLRATSTWGSMKLLELSETCGCRKGQADSTCGLGQPGRGGGNERSDHSLLQPLLCWVCCCRLPLTESDRGSARLEPLEAVSEDWPPGAWGRAEGVKPGYWGANREWLT